MRIYHALLALALGIGLCGNAISADDGTKTAAVLTGKAPCCCCSCGCEKGAVCCCDSSLAKVNFFLAAGNMNAKEDEDRVIQEDVGIVADMMPDALTTARAKGVVHIQLGHTKTSR